MIANNSQVEHYCYYSWPPLPFPCGWRKERNLAEQELELKHRDQVDLRCFKQQHHNQNTAQFYLVMAIVRRIKRRKRRKNGKWASGVGTISVTGSSTPFDGGGGGFAGYIHTYLLLSLTWLPH